MDVINPTLPTLEITDTASPKKKAALTEAETHVSCLVSEYLATRTYVRDMSTQKSESQG